MSFYNVKVTGAVPSGSAVVKQPPAAAITRNNIVTTIAGANIINTATTSHFLFGSATYD